MFRTLSVIAIVAQLAAPLIAQPPIKRVALLIGVEQYQKAGFNNLKYAEDDMSELATVLRANGFDVRLLLGSCKATDQATRANVKTQLDQWLLRA